MARILIIDDDLGLIETLQMVVETHLPDHEMIHATNGIEGLDKAINEHPYVILLDLILPGIDGYELCHALKTDERTKYIPLIIITGVNTDRLLKSRILDAGADGFLSKPFEIVELVAMIKAMLRLKLADDMLRAERDNLRVLVRERSHELDLSLERLELIYKSTNDGIWDWNLVSGEAFFSDHWKETLGYAPDELPPTIDTLWKLVLEDDYLVLRTAIDEYLNRHLSGLQCEVRMVTKTGGFKWFQYRAQAVWDEEGKPLRIVGTQSDITERKIYETGLQYNAQHDFLTGLPNRVLFRDRLHQTLASAERFSTMIAVLFLDFDGFKEVNDVHGHSVGDTLLQQAAIRLQTLVRKLDTVARVGGDEFVIILADIKNEGSVGEVTRRIVRDIAEPFIIQEHRIQIHTSVGIALYPQHSRDEETLIKYADTTMYRAKQQGGNRYLFYQPAEAQTGNTILREMSIDPDRIELMRVPWFDMRTGKRVGDEIVPAIRQGRWKIRIQDESLATIDDIDEYYRIYEKLWQSTINRYLVSGRKFLMVTLPSRLFFHEELFQAIERKPEAFSNGKLIINVSGNILFQDLDYSIKLLNRFRKLGISIAMDNFGIGVFSLQNLQDLPISILRIDESLVQKIGHDPREDEIVKTLVRFAHGMQREVLANGLTMPEQYELLRSVDCNFGQGSFLQSRDGKRSLNS